jgi:hypothetical protein
MSQKLHHADRIRAKAQALVAAGQARNFFHACSILGKHGAAMRQRQRTCRARVQSMWWNR